MSQSSGDLDSTFGTNGSVITAIGTGDDSGLSVVIQPDGKIIVAGYSFIGSGYDFALIRFNPDGSFDNTFSDDGIVTTEAGDKINSVVLQSDGKIIAAGVSYNGFNDDVTVIRYNANGSLDTSFSSDGIVRTDIAGYGDYGLSAAIQPDGKIVVAGRSNIGGNPDIVVVRYNPDGSLDNTFSSDGFVTTGTSTNYIGFSMALQLDGKIVVAGQADDGMYSDFAVARFNTDGSPDSTFSSDGIVSTIVSTTNDVAYSVAIQPDGKIVAAGIAANGTFSSVTVIRYNTDGSLDLTFSGGIVTTASEISSPVGYALALQPDGKIVVAGTTSNGVDCDFTVFRYNPDGTLDNTFSADGIASNPICNFGEDVFAVALQNDGNIVLVGSAWNGSNIDLAIARFLGSSPNFVREPFPTENVFIYPNPASDKAFVNAPLNSCIEILDLQGRILQKAHPVNTKATIDLTEINSGIYFVKVISENKVSIIKIIKEY
ncbi:MAG: hypothetical protein A2X01_11645 [Bacteroidetes bacterium GWF2_35_48]|nr:MAG: hypothetical protein A2X01_11645 [Bacteroidetes bacterium GWF2_35_48]